MLEESDLDGWILVETRVGKKAIQVTILLNKKYISVIKSCKVKQQIFCSVL